MATTLPLEEPVTLGMRLDAALESLDNLSSTQLYLLMVTIMVSFAFAVLGANPATGLPNAPPPPPEQLQKISSSKPVEKPAWHGVVRFFNLTVIACFIISMVVFFLNGMDYSENIPVLYHFLLGWSAFLVYFFSFSGISLFYDNMQDMEEQEKQHHQKQKPTSSRYVPSKRMCIAYLCIICLICLFHHSTLDHHPVIVDNSSNSSSQPKKFPAEKKKMILPAAESASVCSDPKSFTAASTKKIDNVADLKDSKVAELVLTNQLKDHELEKRLKDCHRAVNVRRIVINAKLAELGKDNALEKLPHKHKEVLDYGRVHGANCEIVVGYVPLPVGMVGPLTLNGESVFVPMATTEGCLVASTNRGAKAITQGGGATAVITRDGITRAPCVRMPTAASAAALKLWCERPENFAKLKAAFESTTSFGKLNRCVPTVAGKNVYLRLQCFAGDAMGMNMVSKGSLAVIETLRQQFPELQLVALSGNMCTDKKAAATNWIEGRGKSVVVEAVIPADVVGKTLKTTVKAMVHTNTQKNLIGSAMAGTIGGFNAHASNMVTAVFLATGQDPAQNVESSNCITLLEETDEGDLWISCTMPSLEVGTVGGGTSLPAQAACLKAIGCQGGGVTPGENAQQLAKVVAAATMAGELSLLAALAANTLVAAHMQHNRKPTQK